MEIVYSNLFKLTIMQEVGDLFKTKRSTFFLSEVMGKI